MRKCALLLFIASLAAAQTAPPPAHRLIAIRAARLLDVKAGTYIQNPLVLIENSRIQSITPGGQPPPGSDVIDLRSATLLPGLIDAHTHLLQTYDTSLGFDDPNMLLTVAQMSTAKRALLGVKNGREDLEAGITTVRDLGNSGVNGDVALRDAIASGWVIGPRIVASTRALAGAGGQFGGLAAEAQNLVNLEYAVISGPEEARKAVRQALYDGADCIKVIVNTGPRVLALDEMTAIVTEAHRVHKKVAAHAIGDLATSVAAGAGVDSIEHAYTVPDDVLNTMAAKKIFMVPTDPDLENLEQLMKEGGRLTDAQVKAQMKARQQRASDRIQRAIKAGVRIASGSDMYYGNPTWTRGYASLTELTSLARSGMSPLEVIRAATINDAELLGLSDQIGSLEPGKSADIIAVNGDPLTDIGEVLKVQFVMKGGKVFRNNLVN